MRLRTDVCGLLVGLLSLGCSTVTLPTEQAPSPVAHMPRQVALGQVGPDLRITTPPSKHASPADASPIVPVRAQVPAVQTMPPMPLAETPPPVTNGVAAVRKLYQQAANRYSAVDSYIVRMRRREQVNGKNKPEETLLFKFRKEPLSIYLKWLGKECQGRECVYVKGRYEDKIHTRLAAGDVPFMPAGKRIALVPDNPLVRGSSRHSITEAGFGNILDRMGQLLDAHERGDTRGGNVKSLGPIQRPEFAKPCEALEHTIPPNQEPQLPRGGRRLIAFDPQHHLPVLVQTFDEAGVEVEYYCYDLFQFPVRLDDDDFNPERLWK